MTNEITPTFITMLDEAVTHSCPSKSEMARNNDRLATALYEGEMDKYQVINRFVIASAIVEQFTEFKKILASAVPGAAEGFAEEMKGQTLEMYGAKITINKSKPAFDFALDEEWEAINKEVQAADAALKAAKAKLKAREGVIKVADNADDFIMYYDPATASVKIND